MSGSADSEEVGVPRVIRDSIHFDATTFLAAVHQFLLNGLSDDVFLKTVIIKHALPSPIESTVIHEKVCDQVSPWRRERVAASSPVGHKVVDEIAVLLAQEHLHVGLAALTEMAVAHDGADRRIAVSISAIVIRRIHFMRVHGAKHVPDLMRDGCAVPVVRIAALVR